MEWCSGKYKLKSNISSAIDELLNKDCVQQTFDEVKCSTKEIYDHIHGDLNLTKIKTKSYKKLLIEGFDNEQIYQQIELLNKSAFLHFNHVINSVNDSKFEETEISQKDLDLSTSENIKRTNLKNRRDEYVFDDDSDSSNDDLSFKESKNESHAELASSESDNDSKFDDEDISDFPGFSNIGSKEGKVSKKKDIKVSKRFNKKSIVDDQFFKLSDLTEFLKKEDFKAENNLDEKKDEDIDLFQESGDLSDSEWEDDERKSSKNIMFEDFFDPPESGDEKMIHESEGSISKPEDDELSFNQNDDMSEESAEMSDANAEMPDDNSEMSDEDPEISNKSPEMSAENTPNQTSKTAFELEQEKIKKTILNYEDALIKKPEWHLTGEVAATSRPKDSLLHQETDFDVNAKPVLIEDNILNEKIEKAIKTIIKNKAFSDGERKFKPDDITTYKKDIQLEQTKSTKSLAAVYEEEYLKKKYGEQEEENPKHVEIKKMMDSLLPELQALFSHVPKAAVPDIKIVSNLPAVTVEEVAPTSISDMALLAPEEVKKKSGLVKGITERTDTDKKRERRKKKILQRKKFKKMENDESNENPKTAKSKKVDKLNRLKKLQQHRNTKIADMGNDKIKSSKDFFARLQDTVHSKASSHTKKKKIS